MGGKLSRAKRAGVNISKTYDTSCVQNMLKK